MNTTTAEPLVKNEKATRRSQSIFISYSTADQYFAPLLKDLLEAHGHSVFLAPEDIPAGKPFPDEIKVHLRSSDALVVLVSQGAVASKWVPKQLTIFETENEGARLIPLVLEETDLEQICPKLSKYQAVSLRPCMRSGLQDLFESFGNEFLSRKELRNWRNGFDRHIGTTGRTDAERRVSPLRNRLHIGFQVTYTREARGDVSAPTDLSPGTVARLVAALEPEARRYEFREGASGRLVPPDEALSSAMPVVCEAFAILSPQPATAVFDALANALTTKFDVSIIDRRDDRRRAEQQRQNEV